MSDQNLFDRTISGLRKNLFSIFSPNRSQSFQDVEQTDSFRLNSINLNSFRSLDNLQPSISNFSDFHRALVGDDIVIHALELKLNRELIASIHNFTVYADTIIIAEDIFLPSKNIFLHARKLICNSNIIDVSGKNGAEFDTNAPGIAGIDEDGNSGATGRKGENGGKIIIVSESIIGSLTLKANGGTGSIGQTGADGGIGGHGETGRDANCDNDTGHTGGQGGKGKKGGTAGQGGIGGEGGECGRISVFLVNNSDQLDFELKGGKGNSFGRNGNVGQGGPGGIGGRSTRTFAHGGHGELTLECAFLGEDRRGPSGPIGDPGDNPPNNTFGTDKPDKSTNNCLVSCNHQFIASTSSVTQLGLTLHAASIDYLNNDFNSCAAYLEWLQKLTEKKQISNDLVTFRPDSNNKIILINQPDGRSSQFPIAPNDSEWEALSNNVNVLISQLKAGLDFYGYPKNYIPLISPEIFQAALIQMFEIASSIEVSQKAYWDNLGNNKIQLDGIDQAISSSKGAIIPLQVQITSIDDRSILVKRIINDLDISIIQFELDLIRTSQEFQQAAERETEGCGLLAIIKLVGAVYVAVQTGGAAAGAIVSSVAAIQTATKISDVIKQVKVIASRIGEIKDNIDKLKQAYLDFKAEIDLREISTKIIMNESEFNELFEHFKNLPEAK